MSLPIVVQKQARDAIEQALEWYSSHGDALSRSFLDSLDSCFEILSEQPELYPITFRSVRKAPLRKFPYLVIYRLYPDSISMVAVLHGHRHSRNRKRRLN